VKISKNTLYSIVVALSATVLIVSNLASVKMFDFFGTGLVWDGGAILFPLSYVLGDVITEIYGFDKAKRVVLISLAMNLIAALTLFAVQLLPPGQGWDNQAAYESILGFFPRIMFGSLIAFATGQILNNYVFAKIKVRTEGKHLWIRALGSSLVGDLVDTLIFTTIAFLGTVSTGQFVGLIIIAYVSKIVGEVILLPVTYRTVKFMKKITGEEHFDRNLHIKNLLIK